VRGTEGESTGGATRGWCAPTGEVELRPVSVGSRAGGSKRRLGQWSGTRPKQA